MVIFKGHGSSVLCMAASEPDRELFTGSSDGTARSWNIETGQAIRVFEGHQAPVTCMQVGWLVVGWLVGWLVGFVYVFVSNPTYMANI